MARPSNKYSCPRCGAAPGYNCVLVTTVRRGRGALANHSERIGVYYHLEGIPDPSYPRLPFRRPHRSRLRVRAYATLESSGELRRP